MRLLGPLVLMSALVAVPAAHADPLCDAIRNAARVGQADNRFIPYRNQMPALAGFDCQINMERGLGAYACSTAVEPDAGIARAAALIDTIKACVGSSPVRNGAPRDGVAVFVLSRSPNTWVVVNGADESGRVYMNVVVARRESSDSTSSRGGSTLEAPYVDMTPPYDPGVERPHFEPQPQPQ